MWLIEKKPCIFGFFNPTAATLSKLCGILFFLVSAISSCSCAWWLPYFWETAQEYYIYIYIVPNWEGKRKQRQDFQVKMGAPLSAWPWENLGIFKVLESFNPKWFIFLVAWFWMFISFERVILCGFNVVCAVWAFGGKSWKAGWDVGHMALMPNINRVEGLGRVGLTRI